MSFRDGIMIVDEFEWGVWNVLGDLNVIVDGCWIVEMKVMVLVLMVCGYGEFVSEVRSERWEFRDVDDVFEIEDNEEDEDCVIYVFWNGYVWEYCVVYLVMFCVFVLCVRARDAAIRASWSILRLF